MTSTEWVNTTLGEIASINMGQSPKSKYYNSEGKGFPFLQGNRTFGNIYPKIDTYTTEGHKFSNPGEILLSVRAPVGEINLSDQILCIGRGLASLCMYNSENIFLFYLVVSNF